VLGTNTLAASLRAKVHTAGVSVRCVMCGSSGYEHFVVLTHGSPDPSAGDNGYGQLGDGTTGSCCRKNVPTAVSGDLQWIGLSSGEGHTCGVAVGGTA
jgi:hypothetical protein